MKMEVLAYNPQKGRLENISVHFTEDTTTWFDGTRRSESVSKITDLDGDLLITLNGWNYPVIIYDVSREGIQYSRKKAERLYKQAML
jgi:hypothetical protein